MLKWCHMSLCFYCKTKLQIIVKTDQKQHAVCVMARYSSPDFPCEARRSPGGG